MELQHRAVSGLIWSAIQRGGNQAISFLVFLILSRVLEPADFGLIALATILTSFVQLFVDQGFSSAIVQFPRLDPEHLDTAFWTAIAFGAVLTGTGIGASGFVAGFFNEPRLALIIVWLSFDFVLISLSSTQQACLIRNLDFKALATRTLVATTAGGVAGILSAIAGLGVFSLVVKTLVTNLVGVIVLWNVSDWRPGFRFSIEHFHALFGFGRNITANNFLIFLSKRADNFLIGRFLGTTALGYYFVAYNFIQMLIDLLVSTSTSVTISAFSRVQDDRKLMRTGFYKATHYSSLVAFPIFISVLILSPLLVTILFGEKWSLSIPVMQVLALMGLIYPISIFNTQILVAAGKPSWRLRIMLVYATVDVLGFLIAIRWGIMAVAAALVIRMFLLSPISYWAVHKVIQIDFGYYFRQLIPALLGSSVLAVTLLGLSTLLSGLVDPLLKLLISVIGGGIAYLLAIRLTAPKIHLELVELIRPSLPWLRRT